MFLQSGGNRDSERDCKMKRSIGDFKKGSGPVLEVIEKQPEPNPRDIKQRVTSHDAIPWP